MAMSKRTIGANRKFAQPPRPFKSVPDSLRPFCELLAPDFVYVTHIDSKPREFKQKIFAVPVLLNLAVALLFVCRVYYIGPYYLQLLATTLGYLNQTTLVARELSWGQLVGTVLRRTVTFMMDLCLFIFVWPWPVEFCLGRGGNPMQWRWAVGFREKEIYVRRSRDWYRNLGDVLKDDSSRNTFLSQTRVAASPLLTQEKTGYLTMSGDWDLDWGAMIGATALVDRKDIALEAFRLVVLLCHEEYGWLCLDQATGEAAQDDDRRRRVFAFRDALAAIDKEDLFFRWVEMIQFESTQPGGFGSDKQVEAASRVRELFQSNGIDFDAFWKESVGSDGLAGL